MSVWLVHVAVPQKLTPPSKPTILQQKLNFFKKETGVIKPSLIQIPKAGLILGSLRIYPNP